MHHNRAGSIEYDFRRELFLKYLVADNQVGNNRVAFMRPDVRSFAPGQEFRITVDTRDKIEHLGGAIGQKARFLVFRHVLIT